MASTLKILYSNVGIDYWPVNIDPTDARITYSDVKRELLANQGKAKSTMYTPNLNNTYNSINIAKQVKSKDYFKEFDPRCLSTVGDRGETRNMCENGCLKILPAVEKTMDVHIDNVTKIDADVYLLSEMCENRLQLFRDHLGAPIVRIKKKDGLFTSAKDWNPKIESTTCPNDKIQSKGSYYFAYGVMNGTLTKLPDNVDENDIIKSLNLTAPSGVGAKEAMEERVLSQLYNCNINLLTGKRGDVILLWTVHWPVQNKKSGKYYKEIIDVFNNIIEYLRKNPDVSCVIMGDFNARGGVNGTIVSDCFKTLGRVRKNNLLSAFVSGNDGFMCALNKTYYSDANASEPVLTTPQTTSAHTPLLLTLTETPLPQPQVQPPKQDDQIGKEEGEKEPVKNNKESEELSNQQNYQQSNKEPKPDIAVEPSVKPPTFKYSFNPAKITVEVINGMMSSDAVLDSDTKTKLATFIHKIYQQNPNKISDTPEVASVGMAKRFGLINGEIVKKPGYAERIENIIPQIIGQMRESGKTVMMGGYRRVYSQIKIDYMELLNM